MCFECQRRWKEDHAAAMVAANEHMDAEGIPEDSLVRGVASVQLACNANPMLSIAMKRCWPELEMLLQ
jgi:hypothetical protein